MSRIRSKRALAWCFLGALLMESGIAQDASKLPVVMEVYQVNTTPLSDVEFDLRMRENLSAMTSVDSAVDLRGSQPSPPAIAGVYVRSVRPNSLADQAGIKAGQQLLKVEGRTLSGLTVAQFKALFLLPLGDRFSVTVKRVGSAKAEEIAIPLRRKKSPVSAGGGAPPPKDTTGSATK
jgi:C-terminal processing protease CtpA/Prc